MARKPRSFSAETKLSIVKRMLAGEDIKALARELKVSRTCSGRSSTRGIR